MIWIRCLLTLGFLVVPSMAFTAFLFPPEENQIAILPQKFEYALQNETQIRVGNAIFDSKQIRFSLNRKSSDGDDYKIQVSWPASLLSSGKIQIKDSGAKTIWSESIDPKRLRIQKAEGSKETSANLGSYEADLSQETINLLKHMPFISFCVYRDDDDTKIYLCSEEFYILVKGTEVTARPRVFRGKEALVQIDGQAAGPEGVVSLNSANEKIHFKARSANGAFIEVLTGPQSAEIRDISLVAAGKGLRIQGRGTDPIAKKVERLKNGDWRVVVAIERPYIYLRGRGDVAFRQEFFIKNTDALPTEAIRPVAVGSDEDQTYSSSFTLDGKTKDNTQVTSKDNRSQISNEGGRDFSWTMKDLEKGQWNRRDFNLKSGEQTYTLSESRYRGYSTDLTLGLGIPVTKNEGPETSLSGFLRGRQWLWNRGGLLVDAKSSLMGKKNTSFSVSALSLFYRFNRGMWMENSTALLYVGGESWSQKIESVTASLSVINSGVQWLYDVRAYAWYFDWSLMDLGVGLSSSGKDFTLKSRYKFNWELRKSIQNSNSYWGTGFDLNSLTVEADGASESDLSSFAEAQLFYGILF